MQAARKYKETINALGRLAESKMPEGSKYDRFYIEELVKKFPKTESKQEDLDAIMA